METNDFISWTYTNQDVWLIEDIPVTFSVLSSYTNATVYDRSQSDLTYPRGIVAGEVYNTNHIDLAFVGFQEFSYIGPAIPEPSTTAFFLMALTFCIRIWRAHLG